MLYTGDFTESSYATALVEPGTVPSGDLPAGRTLCVKETDSVLAGLWGWKDNLFGFLPPIGDYDAGCGTTADVNDWIADCGVQPDIRAVIDILIANLGG